MWSNFLGLLKRYPVLAGFILMFVCTWPIDLWAAANSHGLLPSLPIPSILPLFVGYGFVVTSLIMTGIISGWSGIRALLRQFLPAAIGDIRPTLPLACIVWPPLSSSS